MPFNYLTHLSERYILDHVSDEAIMERYTHIPVSKKLFCSPLRVDRHPSCHYYRAPDGVLYIKDFSTGEATSVIHVVMKILGCDYREALRTIARDFFLEIGKDRQVHKLPQVKDSQTRIRVQTQEFTPVQLAWWASYGITPEILKQYNVYSCHKVFLNGYVYAMGSKRCNIYGYFFGMKSSTEHWKIYMPQSKSRRFINNCTQNILQGEAQLKREGKLLIITKSLKDVMTLRSHKLEAVAPSSESTFVQPSKLEELKQRFKTIVVLYDNDHAGVAGMRKIRRKHPELEFTMIPRLSKCKDISDYEKMHGHTQTHQLIKQYILWLNKRKQERSQY